MEEVGEVSGATYMTWEELEVCGDLDRRLHKVDEPSRYYSQSCQSISATTKSLQPLQRDLSRPVCSTSNPATPPVRILKRQPNSDPCLAASNTRAPMSKPIRTLEEREAAYAEARLRILGSATAEPSPTPLPVPPQPNNFKKSPTTRPHQYNVGPESQVCLVNGFVIRR